MRLFVALVPPPEAVAHLGVTVVAVSAAHPDLRWIPPERWHLTLAFLGEVEDRRLPDLVKRLGRAASRHPVLRLRFAGGGRFGRQVLWAGVQGDVPALGRLAGSVTAAARRTGLDVDERPYRPHLTLARTRTPADLRPLLPALAAYDGPEWTAEQVQLVRSRLGPSPTYEGLLRAPLGSPAGREAGR